MTGVRHCKEWMPTGIGFDLQGCKYARAAFLSKRYMTAGADAVLLEGMRIVRCDDSPINSVVAAGAASYVLVSSHSALSPA